MSLIDLKTNSSNVRDRNKIKLTNISYIYLWLGLHLLTSNVYRSSCHGNRSPDIGVADEVNDLIPSFCSLHVSLSKILSSQCCTIIMWVVLASDEQVALCKVITATRVWMCVNGWIQICIFIGLWRAKLTRERNINAGHLPFIDYSTYGSNRHWIYGNTEEIHQNVSKLTDCTFEK